MMNILMKYIVITLFALVSKIGLAQKQSFNWCFGDSAGIDFNNVTAPQIFGSGMNARGSCSSVSDSSGSLLFYASTPYTPLWLSGVIRPGAILNKQHQLMQNGDTIVGRSWYHELVIVPKPGNDSIYYVFSVGVTSIYGLYYSVVDMKANGGLGAVIQKNVMVMPDEQVDCISAVKHGNGRDWWVVGRRTTVLQNGQGNNEFWIAFIDYNGVSLPTFQNIGVVNTSNNGRISFSPTGDTLLFTNAGQVIEYFQFDRCTGVLSNPVTIRPVATTYSDWTWSNEFSSDGRFIYTSTSKDTTQLFQYDLQSPNPLATRATLYQSTFPRYAGGDVKRGPDGKIYFSIAYVNTGVSYPYPDTVYNNYNMNLSVINAPDSLGSACNFQPYSFYLGGKRTYYGLPNNPDYFLGPKIGSPCDTITAISEASEIPVISNIYPNPGNGPVTINYFLANGKQGKLQVYNALGEVVYEQQLARYTYMQQLDLNKLPQGIYLFKLQSGNKVTFKKWIKQ